MTRLREKLTFANVMSSLAVFIALGGTAVALNANSVGSREIKNQSIKGRDVADGKLKGKDLRRSTITSRQIQEAAFDLTPFFRMESGGKIACDPSSPAFIECGRADVTLREPSKAQLVAGIAQYGGDEAEGSCNFTVDEQMVLGAARPIGSSMMRDRDDPNGFALTAVAPTSGFLAPGPHTFELVCNESSGDIEFDTTLSVLAIGGNGIG